MDWTHIPWLTFVLWSLRLAVVFSALTDLSILGFQRWRRKRLATKLRSGQPEFFGKFMDEWALRNGVTPTDKL